MMDVVSRRLYTGVATHVVIVAMMSATASADERVTVTPAVAVETVRDDNIFLTPSGRVADTILRTSPSIDLGYRTPRWQMGLRYAFDAERYLDHPALSAAWARQMAGATLSKGVTERLTIGTEASYFLTNTPQDLNVTTALATSRATAERWSVTPSMTYQTSPRSHAMVSYAYTTDFTRYPLAGGVLNETDNARFVFNRQLTASDEAVVEYQARRFSFGDRSDLSHVITTGWQRRISTRTDVTVQVGPRMAAGQFAPEAAVSLKQRMDRGDMSVEYTRSEGVSIGQVGTVGYQRLALDMAARLGRGFEVRATHGLVKNTSPADGLNALVYAIDINITKAVSPWLAVSTGFHGTIQQGTVAFVDRTIQRSAIMLRLVAGRRLTQSPRQPDGQP